MLHSPPLPPDTFQMMLPWAGEMSPFLTKTEGLGHALQLDRRGVRWETERKCDSFLHFCKEKGLHFKRKLPSRGGSQGGPHSHSLTFSAPPLRNTECSSSTLAQRLRQRVCEHLAPGRERVRSLLICHLHSQHLCEFSFPAIAPFT